MGVITKTDATIRGITYNQGDAFTCYFSAKGDGRSEGGGGSAAALTKGKTYYFLGYVVAADSGSTVKYPYKIGSSASTSSAIGFYKAEVFPYATYAIKYDANGGSGKPSNQTKTYGTALTLSKTTPTRPGYTFQHWNTKKDGSGTSYISGAEYATNGGATLYAIWKANTYTVTFNANGGDLGSVPSTKTKTHSVDLTLPTAIPTRTNYSFKGWGVSPTTKIVAYEAGDTYANNATITLYAIWDLSYTPPRVKITSIERGTSNNGVFTPSDDGKHCRLKTSIAADKTIKSQTADVYDSSGTKVFTAVWPATTTVSGRMISQYTFDPEQSYRIEFKVADELGSTIVVANLSSMEYIIDIKRGGTGIAFNKVAEEEGLCDIGFQTKFTGGIKNEKLTKAIDLDDLRTPNTYVGINNVDYTNQPPGLTGTFTLEVLSAGDTVQVMQRITSCNKTASTIYERFYYQSSWGDWQTISYSEGQRLLHTDDGRYMTAGHTITLTGAKSLSNQPHGYLFVWSQRIDGVNYWYANNYTFMPKYHLKHPAATKDSSDNLIGHDMVMPLVLSENGTVGSKLIMVREEIVTDTNGNDTLKTILTGSACNGWSPNNNWVLRYVLGV